MYEVEVDLGGGTTRIVEYDGVCELHDECDCSMNEAIRRTKELWEPQEYFDSDINEGFEESEDDEPYIEESMSEAEINDAVFDAGSVDDLIACLELEQDDFIERASNEIDINIDDYIDKMQYEYLEKKVEAQCEELEEYRNFIKDITPLMKKLEGKDVIVQVILDDKITPELAKAILDGKVFISDVVETTSEGEEIKIEDIPF